MVTGGLVARRVVSPRLVGRGEELSSLVTAVSAPPAVVVIEGEAGIGKTRLLSELRDKVDGAGRWFVTGWCRRIREPFPLGPVIDAVRGLRDELPSIPLSPVAGALRPLLPEIGPSLPRQPPPLDDRIAERHRVFRALVEVLGSLGPLVLALEDLHWADEQTIDFVNYLLADPPMNLSLVVTFRGEEVGHAVRVSTAKIPSSVNLARLQLRPLDDVETGVLAAAILGAGQVSRDFGRYLHERTSGLPFAIEEMMALLRARGALVRRRRWWSSGPLANLDVPSGIRDSVLERVNRLSPDGRLVAETAAVLQSPVPLPVFHRTCPIRADQSPAPLDEVLESGLLDEHDGNIGFRHLLAGQAVYEAMPISRRQQLHSLAATALSELDPTRVGQLAHHLRHAGQLAAWVEAAERAADQASALGHDDEAVRLLEDMLRHAPLDAEQSGRIAVKLTRAAIETLHAEDVLDLLLGVPTAQLPRKIRSELRFWLALLVNQAGEDPQLSRRLLAEAVDELDDRPDLEAWAMVGLGIPAGDPTVPLSEHLRWLDRSLAVLPRLTDSALAVMVLGKVAMVLTAVGDRRWRELTERMRARTGGTPTRRREVSAYESVASDACYAGHHETARALLTVSSAGAEACQSRRLTLRSQARLALLDYCSGAWSGLRERAELLIEELAHYREARIDAEVVVGCLALAYGDLTTARWRLTDVVHWAERTAGLDLLPLPVGALLRLAVADGDPGAALADAERLLAAVEGKGIWAPAARLLPPLTHAMLEAGRVEPARALVDRMADRLRGLDAPLAAAAVHHAQGLLSAGTPRRRRAAERFLAAARGYDSLICPYEAGQARELAAVQLLTCGDPAAEGLLRQALKAYQRMDASWDAARVAGLARRHGLVLPGVHRGGRRGYGNRLSPREQEVAELAATGLTNDEIARRLFLSPKTVDKHVCAALRKLGLHSRRALAHHFLPAGAGAGREPVRTATRRGVKQ